MAKIVYSAFINSISGKFGASVLARGNASLRSLNSGLHNPRTEKQQNARGHFSDLCGAWYALTDTQKMLWNTYATMSPGLGNGFNDFVAMNMKLLSSGHADLVRINTPPASPATPPNVEGLVATEGVGETTVTWDTPQDEDTYIEIYVSVPVGFFSEEKPKWKHVGTVRSDVGTFTHTHDYPEDIQLIYTALGIDAFGRSSPNSGRTPAEAITRYAVLVDNSGNANTLTNYQVMLTIPADSAVYDNVSPGGGNVRFWDADQATELYFWIQSWNYKGISIFWIKVPSIPGSSTKNIYVHMVDPGESTTSSGPNTFVLWDDFQDYNIGDPLNAARFTTFGTNANNTVNIQNDPAGIHGQVVRTVESGDSISTGFSTITLPARGYAIRHLFRTPTIRAHYFNGKEAGAGVWALALGDGSVMRFRWFNGSAYQEFTPQCPTMSNNTWYDLETRTTKTTLHVTLDGINYTGGLYAAMTDGIDEQNQSPFRKEAITQYIDDYRIRKYSIPDPTATLV